MKPLTEKILKSGLVDRHMVEMLEKWGNLPAGSAEIVNDGALKDATREQLTKLGEEIGDEVDKLRTLKETQLDIDKLRWPAMVNQIVAADGTALALHVPAVIDRMGRLYFRFQDVKESWFVPGYVFERTINSREEVGLLLLIKEQILESSVLYTDDQPVALQVTVHRLA